MKQRKIKRPMVPALVFTAAGTMMGLIHVPLPSVLVPMAVGCFIFLAWKYAYGRWHIIHSCTKGFNCGRSLCIQLFLFFLLFLVGFITTYIHENYDNKIFENEISSEVKISENGILQENAAKEDRNRIISENDIISAVNIQISRSNTGYKNINIGMSEIIESNSGQENKKAAVSGVVEKVSEGTYSKRLMLKKCYFNGRRLVNNIVLEISDSASPGYSACRGDSVEAVVELEQVGNNVILPLPDIASNPGQFDLRQYYKSQGYFYYIQKPEVTLVVKGKNQIVRWLEVLKASLKRVYGECCTQTDAGVYEAMVTGDKLDMDATISELFSAAGIGHILAISGLHISLIGMGIYKLLRGVGFMCPASAAISGILVILFGVMTGNSVSATRAIVMFVCAVNAQVLGKKYDILSAVSLSAIILILKNPYVITNSGFLLSFMAIAGVAVVSEGFTIKCLKWLTGPIAIQLATLPVILWFYYEVPVYSVFLNLLVVPMMSMVMISALGCGFLGLLSLPVGGFFAGAGHYILLLFRLMSELMLSIPGSVFVAGRPRLWQIMLYYLLMLIFSRRKSIAGWVESRLRKTEILGQNTGVPRKPSRKAGEGENGGITDGKTRFCKSLAGGSIGGGCGMTGDKNAGKTSVEKKYNSCINCMGVLNMLLRSVLVLALAVILIRKPDCLEVTFLDVGQGDGVFIQLPNGANVFIDGGSTSSKNIYDKVIEPFLKYKGVRKLDFLFLTHRDADHENGWSQALLEGAYIPDVDNLVLNESDYYRYQSIMCGEDNGNSGYQTVAYGKAGGNSGYQTIAYGKAGENSGYQTMAYGKDSVNSGYQTMAYGKASVNSAHQTTAGVTDNGYSVERQNGFGKSWSFYAASEIDVDEDIEYIAADLAKRKTQILCSGHGMKYIFGECSLTSLNGDEATKNHAASTYGSESENDNSIVLLLEYKGSSMLFTGDMTSQREAYVADGVKNCGVSNVSILKVGHHGSKYSSSQEFLTSIMPEVAVISCAEKNLYGHPHKETLERLENIGAGVLRTDEGGAVIARMKDSRIELFMYGYEER